MLRPALKTDSSSIAQLHTVTLSNSFLANLGFTFLRKLYAFIIQTEKVWVFTEENEIKGFVSFSQNSVGMMKRFIFNCPSCLLLLILQTILHPTKLIRFFETFIAPFKSKIRNNNAEEGLFPSGELLSIAVSPDSQTSGIGSQLIQVLEEYLQNCGILKYKVVAGKELIGANKFYAKNGFILAKQVVIHGKDISNVYIKEISFKLF